MILARIFVLQIYCLGLWIISDASKMLAGTPGKYMF